MEHRTRVVDTGTLLEEYRQLLEQTERLPLLVSGRSMTPFLVHGRDTVYLKKLDRPPRRGDILLYRRRNGAYVLHRVCAVEGERFSAVGDAQTEIEGGLSREQVLAVVEFALRKGRRQGPGDFWWEFFEKVWIRLIPLRPILMGGYSGLKRVFGRTV